MNAKDYAVYKKDVDFDSKCVRPGPKFKCHMCGEWANHMNYVLHKKWYPFLKYNTQILRRTTMNERILKLIEERLEVGERKYGHENVETDGRDFITVAILSHSIQ